ncbi:C-C motif chemokine 3-like 1 [Myxocyprinus asiaticus]|uniref:C-C motif chemokine 3-like 1 n=1 Tax=Myxocyprinus asiaticus TaxID=70543 RepID=UPI002221709D|nr:C-C motif chemokine 3-like 1 [Myxocyprinus asiaticus]
MIDVKICTLCFLILGAFIMGIDSASCCLKYTQRQIRCKILKRYNIQDITRSCDIPAIIFYTENGKSVCADPDQLWVQRRVECLDFKAAMVKTDSKRTQK